jgi:hypothetical protein
MLAAAVLAGVVPPSAGWFAGGAGPDRGRGAHGQFVRSTCMALDHSANLERIAAAGDWPRSLERSSPQSSFMTAIGKWRATDDESMLA